MEPNISPIKDVAIYLRKSRVDETDSDIKKHQVILVDICIKNRWKYTIYREIKSGVSIDARTQMLKLLDDVADGLYDAVLVIDQDRLSRGEGADAVRVKYTFQAADTKLCIKDRVLDMKNEQDLDVYDFTAFFASWEYKTIVKRFQRGKKSGARLGRWTNGPAPFPYSYDPTKQELFVDNEALSIYKWIIESFLDMGMSTNKIAHTLNQRNILTRKGNHWTNKTILDLLVDRTHLGYIIRGKTKKQRQGDGTFKTVYIPQEQWQVYQGLHQPVKTQEEHDRILIKIQESSGSFGTNEKKSVGKVYPLTGLVKCGICGHTLIFQERKDYKDGRFLKKCWYTDKLGVKCNNRSIFFEPLMDEINGRILSYIENYEINIGVVAEKKRLELELILKSKRKAIELKEASLEKVYGSFEREIYDEQEFVRRRNHLKSELRALEEETAIIQLSLNNLNNEASPEKLNLLKIFSEVIKVEELTNEDLNSLYSSIIKAIYFIRDEQDNVSIDIEYN